MKRLLTITKSAAILSILVPMGAAFAQTPRPPARLNGARQFDQICTTCHGNADTERAPDPSVLRKMTPERIYEALTTGACSGGLR
jgi:mono/diheme cytochrome c family protein